MSFDPFVKYIKQSIVNGAAPDSLIESIINEINENKHASLFYLYNQAEEYVLNIIFSYIPRYYPKLFLKMQISKEDVENMETK